MSISPNPDPSRATDQRSVAREDCENRISTDPNQRTDRTDLCKKWLFYEKRMWDRTCLVFSGTGGKARENGFWVPWYKVPDSVRIDSLAGPSKILANHIGVLSMCTLHKYNRRGLNPLNQKLSCFKSRAKWTWSAKAHHRSTFCLEYSYFTYFDRTLHIWRLGNQHIL